ncbi:hypothetical protein BD324DRAFT_629036 [Kockovaella imperatae]|uniref:Uncharacterized protein n=1 Tax=Kockovaella imperatae TaxID=4999 RepID=A0A1Y1UES4_9TREE|nr:hypothetical protein BD324DRAFT_629036 [Kockovaella imperatae]ORX36489.1 hypothetical protein BD324DRAFT_629036 [Kockovaella imperatae]
MPYISTEALVGAALLVVLALGYQYAPKNQGSGSSKKKAKRKNKKNGAPVDDDVASEKVESSSTNAKKGNKGPKKQQNGVGPHGAKDVTKVMQEQRTVEPEPKEEGDEAVGNGPSFAAVASSSTSMTQGTAKPKTLAERLAPKARKTKVDDMLDPEDLPPTHARVMKIVNPRASSTPSTSHDPAPSVTSSSAASAPVDEKVSKFSEDYTSESEGSTVEDDGWNVVQSKPKKAISLSLSGPSSSSHASSIPGGAAPLPVSTKTQRKNAKKSEAKKAARAAEEEDRQRRLAMHKRDLQRERINEIYTAGKKKPGNGGGGKSTASATVDQSGKLVWD